MKMELSEFAKNLATLREEFGFTQKEPCTPEETAKLTADHAEGKELPCDIGYTTTETFNNESNASTSLSFYRIVPSDISSEEKMEYLALLRSKNIKTIKNCVVFFTVLMVISLCASVILALT